MRQTSAMVARYSERDLNMFDNSNTGVQILERRFALYASAPAGLPFGAPTRLPRITDSHARSVVDLVSAYRFRRGNRENSPATGFVVVLLV